MALRTLDIGDKLIAENVSFIMTENCPYKCAHCMRGKRRALSISEEVIDAVLSQIVIEGTLHLGGGEPLMQTKKAVYLINKVMECSFPETISIITNGSICKQKFEEFISGLSIKGVFLDLVISNDCYHRRERLRLNRGKDNINTVALEYAEVMDKYGVFYNKRGEYKILEPYEAYKGMLKVSAIGRGINIKGSVLVLRDFELQRNVILQSNGRNILGDMQVQPNGLITPAFDMSWEERDSYYNEDNNILSNPLRKILSPTRK